VIGDTEAMIAAGRLGENRFLGLLEKYGWDTVSVAIEQFLDYCERMLREQLEQVPDGTWEAEGWLDDDGRNRDERLYVHAKVTIEGSDITIDLSKSCDNVPTGFNVPFGGSTLPGIYTVIRSVFLDEATFTDFIPQNDGIFRPIKVIAREGSIFNPTFPRSALSRVCPIMRASDAAIQALSDVVPDRVCAGSSAVGVGVYTGYVAEKEEYWVHVEINEGIEYPTAAATEGRWTVAVSLAPALTAAEHGLHRAEVKATAHWHHGYGYHHRRLESISHPARSPMRP
jgi:N-methylhydantoinase B/oxoprolinase/acetone carboxylase alpha subunit